MTREFEKKTGVNDLDTLILRNMQNEELEIMRVIDQFCREHGISYSFTGEVYDYKDFVLQKKYFKLKREHLYRAVTSMWDNTPRRKNRSTIFDGATPNLYKQWLSDIILETNKNTTIDDKIILINAWNKWAEGAYLEPDLKWQYGYLEATRDAILECRNNKENKV